MFERMTTMTTCIEKTAEGADRLLPTTLSNDAFSVEMDASTGAIVAVRHPDDSYGMNWVIDPREAGQIGRSHCWGLGYAGMGSGIFWGRSHWDAPCRFEIDGNRCRITYEVSGLSIEVERVLHADHLAERYTFALTTEREHTMGGDGDGAFGVFTPWNDNYPDSATRRRHLRSLALPAALLLLGAGLSMDANAAPSKPVSASAKSGKGSVAVFTVTVLGEEKNGELPFWKSKFWPILLNRMINNATN